MSEPEDVKPPTTPPAESTVPLITDADPPFDAQCADADVILRSSDNVDFRVVRAFLSFSSQAFKDLFALPRGQCGSDVDEVKDGLPIVVMPEDSTLLGSLLQFCYPICAVNPPQLETLQIVLANLELSRKYIIEGMERRARQELVSSRFLDEEPLRVFAVALSRKLEQEARFAAVKTLRHPLSALPYTSELEDVTAGDIMRLQSYHRACAEVSTAVAKNLEWIERDNWTWFECTSSICKDPKAPSHTVTISGGRKRKAAVWWEGYIRSVSTALHERPAGDTVKQADIWDATLNKGKCGVCRARFVAEMKEFTQLFEAEIDKAISKVCLSVIRCLEDLNLSPSPFFFLSFFLSFLADLTRSQDSTLVCLDSF
jgi:hypothetical protein